MNRPKSQGTRLAAVVFATAILSVFGTLAVQKMIPERTEHRSGAPGCIICDRSVRAKGDFGGGQGRIDASVGRSPRSLPVAPGQPVNPDQLVRDRFQRYADLASTAGDYRGLSGFFDDLGQAEREEYYRKVIGVFSRLGPSHDIREKLALLEKVEASSNSLQAMRTAVLEREAVERYGEMRDEGVLATLTDQEFAAVCRRLAINRLDRAFEAAADGGSETAIRAGAASVARSGIAGGTMAASKVIANLPPGIIRDEAVVELVLWLRRTGAEDEAAPWESLIVDEVAKSRLSSRK